VTEWISIGGCEDRVTQWISATDRVTHICGAAHFSRLASTLKSGDAGLTLNFGQRVIKERREESYPRESFGSAMSAVRI